MTERLPTQYIFIPSKPQQKLGFDRVEVAINICIELGLNPVKVAQNRMGNALLKEFIANDMQESLRKSLRNLAILNPNLK
jgi:hypothetical protein